VKEEKKGKGEGGTIIDSFGNGCSTIIEFFLGKGKKKKRGVGGELNEKTGRD